MLHKGHYAAFGGAAIAANVLIPCPTCGRNFPLRYDPGPEDAAPAAAAAQLKTECPDHVGPWRFWKTLTNTPTSED